MEFQAFSSPYTVIKANFSKVVKDQTASDIIKRVVLCVHRIKTHTDYFLKIYLLLHYNTHNGTLPKITESFVMHCFQVVRQMKLDGRTKNLAEVDDLTEVFEAKYRRIMSEEDIEYLQHPYLTQILGYCATEIVTEYETNIKQHYVEYVERFVNAFYDKKATAATLTTEKEKEEFINNLRKYKQAILERDATSLPADLRVHFPKIIVQRPLKNNNINYDLKCSPQDYLPCMIYIMRFVESKGYKLYNVFPMRTESIPKYITLDTASLAALLIHDPKYFPPSCKAKKDIMSNIGVHKDYIWRLFFNIDMRCFERNGYEFKYMIETDGVGCSILFVRDDLKGVRYNPGAAKSSSQRPRYYLDELPPEEKARLRDKRIVAIDPGKSDLIYCVSKGEGGKVKHFRYTHEQRKYEGRTKKYKHMQEQMKKEEGIQEIEAELSKYNHKTLDVDKFIEYVEAKNRDNAKLPAFYEQEVFRKMRWHAYINMSRSESKMINRFKEEFGPPSDVVIAMGDWEQHHQMRYKEPSKGVGMRKIFKQHGYVDLYLANEYRTSKKCSHCQAETEGEGECEKFMRMPNPRPCKDANCLCTSRDREVSRECKVNNHKKVIIHGLVRCKTCHRIWNRDVNGALNILAVAEAALNGENRPKYLYGPRYLSISASKRASSNIQLVVDDCSHKDKKRKINQS